MSMSIALDQGIERLGLSSVVALSFHLAIVFGIGFSIDELASSSQTLEITLAPHKSNAPPEHADFVAQNDQQGSGSLDEKRELTTTKLAPLEDNTIRDTTELPARRSEPARQTAQAVIGRHNPASAYREQPREPLEPEPTPAPDERAALEPEQQIQSLEAKLDRQRQAFSKRPRIHRITSVSTRHSEDARYQIKWQQRVEEFGNRHYPDEARRQQLSGDVRLAVALLPDGRIKRIDILASSGRTVLDQAAIRSVKLAAPFEPFPPELRDKADILEIIRTWQYRNNQLTSRG